MHPRHDPVPKVPAGRYAGRSFAETALMAKVMRRVRRGPAFKGRPDVADGGEPCPVESNRPLDLSGGAAAALEFD